MPTEINRCSRSSATPLSRVVYIKKKKFTINLKNKFAVRRNGLNEDPSGFKVVPATENEFKDSVIRNELGQLERMYINAELYNG